jgi:F0F1-type ATP synthase assembly protein I
MPDDEHGENQEPVEDEFETRFRELEAKAKAAREGTKFPDPPKFEVRRPVTPTGGTRPAPSTGRSMGLALAIGYSFVGPLLAGILIGKFLDHNNGTTYTIVGMLIGTVLALVLLVRLVGRLNDNDN